jgi:hypothetical protein
MPEDSSLHNHRCENHKSYNILMFSNAVKGYHYSSTPTHMFWSMEHHIGNNVIIIIYLHVKIHYRFQDQDKDSSQMYLLYAAH